MIDHSHHEDQNARAFGREESTAEAFDVQSSRRLWQTIRSPLEGCIPNLTICWSTLVSLLVQDTVCVGCRHFGGSRRYLPCINGPGFCGDPVSSSGRRDIVPCDGFE